VNVYEIDETSFPFFGLIEIDLGTFDGWNTRETVLVIDCMLCFGSLEHLMEAGHSTGGFTSI
jgi:hypothetical protein